MGGLEILVIPGVLLLFFGLLQAALTATRLAAGTTLRLGSTRYASLADFVARFGDELGLAGEAHGHEPDATSARFRGELASGRPARVELVRAAWGAPAVARASVLLGAREAAPVQRTIERARAKVARWGVASLELAPRTAGDGKLALELVALVPEERATPGELAQLLAELDALVERERLVVKLAANEPATRCALCHGDLDARSPDHAPCERCGAVLHAACWADLGRCPALACPGRARLSGAPPPVTLPAR
jgi:hypothetical protein